MAEVRLVFAYVFAFLPMPLKRLIAQRVYGWDLHPTAYIGPSVLTVRHLSMGPGAKIGARNTITNVDELRMGEGAIIGSGNMVKGWWDHPTQPLAERSPSLVLGDHAQIASYHYIDCVDTLELGSHAAIAGFRSTVLTHSIDLSTRHLRRRPGRPGGVRGRDVGLHAARRHAGPLAQHRVRRFRGRYQALRGIHTVSWQPGRGGA